MDEGSIKQWLAAYKNGSIDESEIVQRLKNLPFEDIDFAKIDHHRTLRRGFPEVIYGEGKTTEQIIAIAHKLHESGEVVLITRLDEDQSRILQKEFCPAKANLTARTVTVPAIKTEGAVSHSSRQALVITAGTSDLPVAEEAVVTVDAFGYNCDLLSDVGVAGLHRLLAYRERIERADAIAVVAGMEGALASVVGGLVEVPVIAVPTSIGYGASFGGVSALLGMLTGCAGGVAVVNIDNGFAAGYMLATILRNLDRDKSAGI